MRPIKLSEKRTLFRVFAVVFALGLPTFPAMFIFHLASWTSWEYWLLFTVQLGMTGYFTYGGFWSGGIQRTQMGTRGRKALGAFFTLIGLAKVAEWTLLAMDGGEIWNHKLLNTVIFLWLGLTLIFKKHQEPIDDLPNNDTVL